MLKAYRDEFNRRYMAEQYRTLLTELNRTTRTEVQFRVCETPCFFPKALLEELSEIGQELTDQLLGNPAYLETVEREVPEMYRVPGASPHPHFMTVDFGFVRTESGALAPKLVELQAFPSVFGYQDILSRQYCTTYGLGRELGWLLGGHDEASYWEMLRRVIVGEHDPENVVLTEVEPAGQKTLPDFRVYEERLGVATVDIASVWKEGTKIYYDCGGRAVPIHRIFNRAIVDEIERKGVRLGFDWRDELEVEWAGHPNWFFKISKFSLPYLNHPSVPKAMFLDDWFRAEGRGLPEERDRLLLKPLYSFAGKGIQFGPSDADLATIPEDERRLYLMQERMNFEPIIETPEGMTQAEVRVMYLWPDGGRMEPAISLVRLGRGLMMGVDHNRNQEWVGGSAALFPQG